MTCGAASPGRSELTGLVDERLAFDGIFLASQTLTEQIPMDVAAVRVLATASRFTQRSRAKVVRGDAARVDQEPSQPIAT